MHVKRRGGFRPSLAKRQGGASLSWGEHHWYRQEVNFFPPGQDLFERDLPRLIREYAILGHTPPKPVLESDDAIITIGSCFARELQHLLARGGLRTSWLDVPAGLNNTYALLDFVSWCITGNEMASGFRYERLDSGEIREWKPEDERAAYRNLFAEAGAFLFTLGLAEVWEDRETGGVFWRGVPDSIFDAGRHVFRLTTVDENARNIAQIIELIRKVNQQAPIVLTLSPVPAKATFREISCMSADSVSKSVLRIALDRVMADRPAGVYYWPSFEIVKWAGPNLPWPAYGFDDRNPRHVTRYLVSEIVDAFVESFYSPVAVAAMRTRVAAKGRRPRSPETLYAKLAAARDRRRRALKSRRDGGRRVPAIPFVTSQWPRRSSPVTRTGTE